MNGRGNKESAPSMGSAYQLVDRYVEEGRRYAEAHSAWFGGDAGQPDAMQDAARVLADLLALLPRVIRELGRVGTVPTVLRAPAHPFHPQQDPAYGRSSPAPMPEEAAAGAEDRASPPRAGVESPPAALRPTGGHTVPRGTGAP